ncbi:zinc finger protein 40 isoform X2 [Colius striatus]|uniref:zinc finger protein 40 isoform X2 n=1 Tax=Colius striatus TaxID=57412 RepID=UPI002B1D8A9D|nr:zinc finger protein 40 isoform X2 [Colius striatus]
MPRTKQIHPRNLRDKIEEAQKQLNGTEDQQREITDAGTRGTQDTIKGVKRKKIVTENHLKKIPKSPLRSPAEAKVKQNVDPSPLKALPDASEHSTAQDHTPVQNGNQCTSQNGGVPSSEIRAETAPSETSMQTKLSLTHQSLNLGTQAVEETAAKDLNSPEKSLSNSSSSKTKTDSNECITFADCGTSSPCTRTAFDVLLKAMEPELNTLAQECPTYGMQIEKLRPNKTVSTSSSLTSNTMSVQNQAALSQQDFAAGPRYYPCTLNNVHVAAAAKTGQAQGPSLSHSQDLPTKTSQQSQQVVMCPSFTRSLVQQQQQQQGQENPKLQQLYSIAVTSSVVHTSPSTVSQVFPQNQLVASSSSPQSISTSSSTHLSIGPMYNSAQIASVVNHGVEQICSLLKDQKPKKLGKYVCEYCNRACAKPSVLQKHIRSHTGERPYPCVTCGFSFKTKSNLYKHKKSHAHAIKLGLVLQPDSSGLFLSPDSDKALSIHSDVEESGESEDEGTADERQDEQEPEPGQIVKVISSAETLRKGSPVPSSNPDCIAGDSSLHDTEPQVRAALPKVVVHPVNVSPLRADSPKVTEPAPELAAAQRKGDLKVTALQSNLTHAAPFKENDAKQHQKGETGPAEEQVASAVGAVHAQLQRQQATDGSQEQQGKCLLSPRSLGSTDSGYFSRSESADQTMSPPAPLVRGLLTSEKDANKTLPCVPRASGVVASVVQTVCAEKNLMLSGQMRPPMATKTLEERISKLISDNEAVVDDKQLDSVKPRRTSLSRRGSIDSPKSYIFKDSFQFDLKPMGRRTSSSSDIPKSPFTPTEKSKQVFLLSVPSLDCLPITRSNSMPTTSYSAVPPNVIPPSHPLRGSQSFDDKIGSLYDDVFVSGPAAPLSQGGHPRPLVRQAAIEDSSTGESQVLGPVRSVEETYLGCNLSNESLLQRSKSLAQGSNVEKTKKSPQVRGTMFECETCRNRYRKLENFENHKKFYCSELHGPKTKAATREPEHKSVPNSTQPQILHYRVTTSTGVWEQTPQIRKRRKMKSVGDDDDPQQNDTGIAAKNTESQSKAANSSGLSKHGVTTVLGSQQPGNLLLQSPQIQLVARGTDQPAEPKMAPLVEKQAGSTVQEKVELKRQGTGISVIQHTNSLSRNSSFEKSESFERASPVSSQEPNKVAKHRSLNTVVIQEDRHPRLNTPQHHQPLSLEAPRGEVKGSQIVSTERSAPLQPSRLIRQHNIQVPEILVTEEPDRDQENQCSDQEKTERFNWPQRSETLSKLPTEKLPPKKKRIRLAEMEHSSAESSLDSTLSRSLSRESSLSHASSFSASLDKDDTLKAENPSKAEAVSKPSEFLMIPAGSHALAVPGPHYREMRRAASEQISCTQPSMEVVDYRSKSFDCGSMSPSKAAPLLETAAPKGSSANGVTGHVPLLERRRGPFVRQISLNIAPESPQPQVKATSSFQAAHVPDVPAAPLHRLQPSGKPSVEFPSSTQHSQTHSRPHAAVQNCTPVSLASAQQPLDHALNHQGQGSSTRQPAQPSAKTSAQGEQVSTYSLSCHADDKKDCFAPKYQLQVKTLYIGQPYSSKLLKNTLATQTVPSQAGAEQNAASFELQAKLSDVSNPYSVPPLKQIVPNNCSSQIPQLPPFVVPVRIHSSVPSYGFATVTALPHILVTQEQGNRSVCKTSVATVPTLEGKTQVPKSHKDHQRTLPNSFEFENSQLELRNSPLSSSLNIIQKVPVSGLFPQPEATASSKRMLSPANSLDIAMEKQQKRVKDESGAACVMDNRPLHSLNLRSNDPTGKQKKPVLVRQVCTTEPLENHLLDPDGVVQHEKSSKAGASDLLVSDRPAADTGVSETPKESPESEDLKSSASPVFVVRKPSELSPVNNQSSLLKAGSGSQERRSPGNESKNINSQGQARPVTTLAAMNAGEMQRLSFPSLKTTTSFTWCYLLKRKPLHLLQNDQKISAYSTWTVSPNNPNPLGLSTKVALSLLNSKQKVEKPLYTQARTTHPRSDVLVYSSKWKNSLTKRALNRKKLAATEFSNKENSESSTEHDKENSFIKTEPRRVKIFDGGYKSNEDYVYVRGRGRGKYICEECGIRCKKPSMLKKHIRTHTDVRPYHCNYCNFSFKTKGNLTKHMKSKAHSKKCMDLGVSVGLIDDQDGEEEFGEKQRFGYDRSGYDVEESDGADEDENDNEDDDEDSQAESVLSTTPSVTASPQHHPSRHGLQDTAGTDEDIRLPDCFAGVHTDSMDGLPKALLTKMTVLSAVQSVSRSSRSPAEFSHQEAAEDKGQERGAGPRGSSAVPVDVSPPSPGHQMSVDYPDPATALGHSLIPTTALTKSAASVGSPSSQVAAPYAEIPEEKPPGCPPPANEPRAPQTHLFSHLPLHSQRQAKAAYGTVPVGGIQVVPAGLATYSTFVPIQAGPVQLTIPAVGVIHRTTSALGETGGAAAGPAANPVGMAEVNGVVPCIPIGQVSVPGIQGLGTPGLQPLPPLGVETLNILGLANANIAPQMRPSGITLNAVGLQVLTAGAAPPGNPSRQPHIPGLQILNIALPTLIPSVGPAGADGQGAAEPPAAGTKAGEAPPEPAEPGQAGSAASPQRYGGKSRAEPSPRGDRPDGPGKADPERTEAAKLKRDGPAAQAQVAAAAEPRSKADADAFAEAPLRPAVSPDRQPSSRRGARLLPFGYPCSCVQLERMPPVVSPATREKPSHSSGLPGARPSIPNRPTMAKRGGSPPGFCRVF